MRFEKKNLDNLRSEGDLNISPRRKAWAKKHIDAEAQHWLDLDAQYFLHQSLSTPCLNVLSHCEGINLQDLQGRDLMDFHGNNVHQVGFANRRVIEAIKNQMDKLAFCTRRYTNIPAIKLSRKIK
jgi:4-aminobutyrate aminotransferase